MEVKPRETPSSPYVPPFFRMIIFEDFVVWRCLLWRFVMKNLSYCVWIAPFLLFDYQCGFNSAFFNCPNRVMSLFFISCCRLFLVTLLYDNYLVRGKIPLNLARTGTCCLLSVWLLIFLQSCRSKQRPFTLSHTISTHIE